MHNRWKLSRTAGVFTAAVLAAGVLSAIIGSAQFAQAVTVWTSACVAPTYAPSTVPSLTLAPSTAIGTTGTLPVSDDHPWGADKVNDLVYRSATHTLVAGGLFPSYIHGTTYVRHNVVEFNAQTGAVTSFAPNVDGEVLDVALSCTGSDVYLAGYFHHVNGVARNYVAKVNLSSGAVESWNPNPSGPVHEVALAHDRLILVGSFKSLNGIARAGIASVDQTYGKPTSWLQLSLSGYEVTSSGSGSLFVRGIKPNHHGTQAIIFGNFNTANGHTHRRMLMLNLSDTAATLAPWNTAWTASNNNANAGTDCSASFTAPELDVAWSSNDTRWVSISTGGPHHGSICDSASKWSYYPNATAAAPINIQYTGGDTLSAGVCTDTVCYLSGHFRWGDNAPRYPAVRQDPCNNTVNPFNPNPGNAGYDCQSSTSQTRPGIMKITLSTMKVDLTWNPGRDRQEAMHNRMVFTPYGMCLGTDGNHVGTYAGDGGKLPIQPRNDLACWPYAA